MAFKKGVSGNPKGRPKGDQCMSVILRQKLEENVRGGDKTKAEAVADKIIEQALEGDGRCLELLFNRTEGAVKQSVEVESKSEFTVIMSNNLEGV